MNWQERRDYEVMVNRFRRMVGSLPYWTVEERDGEAVVVDVSGNAVLLHLNSQWNRIWPGSSARSIGIGCSTWWPYWRSSPTARPSVPQPTFSAPCLRTNPPTLRGRKGCDPGDEWAVVQALPPSTAMRMSAAFLRTAPKRITWIK